ncbi:MAG: GTPase HflX [Candidatus Eisenbacteria bacterium]|nr:GTPase HflX [Candidatus Eisenbacteria bacterium]
MPARWRRPIKRKYVPKDELAILIGVSLPSTRTEEEHESLDELAQLARSAGATVVERFVQNRTRIDGTTYIGSGMIERVKAAAAFHGANLLIFDDDLRPAQGREIERSTEIKVIDRTELILDIFARRAQTKVARAQVELAQLEYELPRLRRLWDHLERLGGGIGTRGPGETQLESDRRLVRTRIRILRKMLTGVEVERREQRKRRSEMTSVALVGYTNAGKSTLMNALSGADVLTEDLLFATLDPTTRKLDLPGGHAALLTDTVGLIKKLPHHLVVSFHATLEEVVGADLLLHVVDASKPNCERYMELADRVLSDIGVVDTPIRLVFNKTDRIPDREGLGRLGRVYPGALFTSATTGKGLDDVRGAITAFVESREEILDVAVPFGDGRTISAVYEMGEVLSREDESERLRMRVRVSCADAGRLKRMGIVI